MSDMGNTMAKRFKSVHVGSVKDAAMNKIVKRFARTSINTTSEVYKDDEASSAPKCSTNTTFEVYKGDGTSSAMKLVWLWHLMMMAKARAGWSPDQENEEEKSRTHHEFRAYAKFIGVDITPGFSKAIACVQLEHRIEYATSGWSEYNDHSLKRPAASQELRNICHRMKPNYHLPVHRLDRGGVDGAYYGSHAEIQMLAYIYKLCTGGHAMVVPQQKDFTIWLSNSSLIARSGCCSICNGFLKRVQDELAPLGVAITIKFSDPEVGLDTFSTWVSPEPDEPPGDRNIYRLDVKEYLPIPVPYYIGRQNQRAYRAGPWNETMDPELAEELLKALLSGNTTKYLAERFRRAVKDHIDYGPHHSPFVTIIYGQRFAERTFHMPEIDVHGLILFKLWDLVSAFELEWFDALWGEYFVLGSIPEAAVGKSEKEMRILGDD